MFYQYIMKDLHAKVISKVSHDNYCFSVNGKLTSANMISAEIYRTSSQCNKDRDKVECSSVEWGFR